MASFGLIPDPPSDFNPDGLPIGFAKDVDPDTGETSFGLNCAACHVGQVAYRGAIIRIDGGPGNLDTTAWGNALIAALTITEIPTRFNRFADKVLGEGAGGEARSALRRDMTQLVERLLLKGLIIKIDDLEPTASGYGRTDALGRGGNNICLFRVFRG